MISLADVDLVLASSSRYRRELLARLTSKFRCIAPNIDEAPISADEEPDGLAARLSRDKAQALTTQCPGALIIGSDQVAWHTELGALGKPGSAKNARAQLAACSNRTVEFHTGVCLFDPRNNTHECFVDITRVRFRALRPEEIARYVERERPLDCAGGFKCESLGISLFESIETRDPTALIGLPLIALCRLLYKAGIEPL